VPAQIAIVLNSRSGSAPRQAELARILEVAGVVADIHSVPVERKRAGQWIGGLANQYETLVAAGGDGTVSSVAAAAAKAGKTLGVIPVGTLNHFARDAGIPVVLEQAIVVLAAGHTRSLDAGVVNDRIFINNASIGAYPRMVWERKQAGQRGLPRPVAHLLAVVDTWLELSWISVRLSVDGRELVRRSPFVVVGNNEYEVEGMQFGKRATLTAGRLSLYVAPDSGRLDAVALIARALVGRLKQSDKFEAWLASSIAMDMTKREIAVALDGEIHVLDAPLRFSVKPGALNVIVPAEREG